MTSSSSSFEDLLDDFFCNADNFLQKAVCLYALEKCRQEVAGELSDMLAHEVRKGARVQGSADPAAGPDELTELIRKIVKDVKNNPELLT